MTGRGRRVQKAHPAHRPARSPKQADDARERSSSWRIGPSRWPARAPMSGRLLPRRRAWRQVPDLCPAPGASSRADPSFLELAPCSPSYCVCQKRRAPLLRERDTERAMSQENVKVCGGGLCTGERPGSRGALGARDEDLVWISDPGFPGEAQRQGERAAVVEQDLDLRGALDRRRGNIDLDDRALGITRCNAVPQTRRRWTGCGATWFRSGMR